METAQALIISAYFFVKLAGFIIFCIGIRTVWKWAVDRGYVSFYRMDEDGIAEDTGRPWYD